jgi:hypothetical protein
MQKQSPVNQLGFVVLRVAGILVNLLIHLFFKLQVVFLWHPKTYSHLQPLAVSAFAAFYKPNL